MKCPLLHHKEHNPDVFPGETFEDCLKDECAWWSQKYSGCAILGYIEAYDRLGVTLRRLDSKMPLGGAK